MGADRRRTVGQFELRVVAYSRGCSVELPLRPSARAAAPSVPRLLRRRLRAREWRLVLRSINGHSQKGGHWGGGALERGHGAPLERLAQLGDALGGVGAVAHEAEAAELVVAQAAKVVSGSVNGR